MACGIALLFAGRWIINDTTAADRIVASLLVQDRIETADAIVVPGAGVVNECTPNQNGVRRVLLAAALWRAQRAPVVVFSGGTGSGTCSVARTMAILAHDVGVPDDAIRIETASRSTWENASFSAPLLKGWGMQRLLLVTDRLHMVRASAVFAHFGFTIATAAVPVQEGHDDNVSMLAAGLREYAALAYYRMRGRLDVGEMQATPGGPARVSEFVPAFGAGPLAVLGASYAASWSATGLAGIPVVNLGVAGQQSSEMRDRFEREVVTAKPRAVMVWGFINDVFRASGDMDATLAATRASYEQMIAMARTHGIEPILCTEVTMRPPASWSNTLASWIGPLLGKQSYQDGINRHVRATNAWIRELGAREHLLVLDFETVLSDERGLRRPAFAQPDGSHITAAGYDALTSYAAPILQEHFMGRRSGS
jgi:uncharacterized SAM-binding protein YcdF (DUF218 family)/lysophospholipase L1-like esterase